jgi:cysteinyl-tRNA synthetase
VLSKAFSPDVARFFMLQAHYRSVLDLSSDALEAAEKGYERLLHSIELLADLPKSKESSANINDHIQGYYTAMNDDFNSPVLIAQLFETVKLIHRVKQGEDTLTGTDIEKLSKAVNAFIFDVLGLTLTTKEQDNSYLDKALSVLIDLREQARTNKDFATADRIRDELLAKGIQLKDGKDGTNYGLSS